MIVANDAQLVIVSCLKEPTIWLGLTGRCLIAGAYHGLKSVICPNGTHLASGGGKYRRLMQRYLTLGYEVLFTGAATGQGVDELGVTHRDRGTVLACQVRGSPRCSTECSLVRTRTAGWW